MNKQVVALSINKVQTFLFDTIHAHVQEKQTEKATLRSIQRASREVSDGFKEKIAEKFHGFVEEELLFCSGVYIFYTTLSEEEIRSRLNQLFREYYRYSEGKQQLRYVHFSAKDDNKLNAINRAKRGLKDAQKFASILEENREVLFTFQPIQELDMEVEIDEQQYPSFADDINALYSVAETKNDNHFRIAVIKADLDGMGDMFQNITSYEQYNRVSQILNEYIGLKGFHDIISGHSEKQDRKPTDCQGGWVFPFYIAGDDIFFAVSVGYLLEGINICRNMLEQINGAIKKLNAENINQKQLALLHMSIGVEIVFNREPVRYYLSMVEEQLTCAKRAKVDKCLGAFYLTKIAIHNTVWVDLDTQKIKSHKGSLKVNERKKINEAIGQIAVWKYLLNDIAVIADIHSDEGKSSRSQLIGNAHFFYSLLDKLTTDKTDDVQYMTDLLYHLAPQYSDSTDEELAKAELRLNKGIIHQLFQKKTNGEGDTICPNKTNKNRLETYLRLMLLFSDERFLIRGISTDKLSSFDDNKESIRKELLYKPRQYIYNTLKKRDADLLNCFVHLHIEKENGKVKGECLKSIRMEKSMFIRIRDTEKIHADKAAAMIKMKNPDNGKEINEKNAKRVEDGKKAIHKYFNEEKFCQAAGENWDTRFVDMLMLLYEYHKALIDCSRIGTDKGGSKK